MMMILTTTILWSLNKTLTSSFTAFVSKRTESCQNGFNEVMDCVAISQKKETAQGNETSYIDHKITRAVIDIHLSIMVSKSINHQIA